MTSQRQSVRVNQNWTIGWMIAFLGFPIGGALATAVIRRLDNVPEALLGGALVGSVIGATQMLALRPRLPITLIWIGATAAGLAVGVAVNTALFGTETTLSAILTRAPLTGLMLGTAQWLVLRQHVRGAFWWIPGMTLLYPVAWFVTVQVIQTSVNQGFVVFGASGALVFQLASVLLLSLLIRSDEAK